MTTKSMRPGPLSQAAKSDSGNRQLAGYDEAGVDLTLIRWMLSLTATERLQVLQQTVLSLERLRRAKPVH